jgi:hypothetical protein
MHTGNPFGKPASIAEKYQQWKTDLDRTQGNTLESLLGRYFDRLELNRLNTRVRILHAALRRNPFQAESIIKELIATRQKRQELLDQIEDDLQKAKHYQPGRICAAKKSSGPVYTNPPNVVPILKKGPIERRDSKLSFAEEALEIEFDLETPVVKIVHVHFAE